MIIDSHVHLKHGDAAGTQYTPQAVVRIMDAAGVDRSVVFAMATTTQRSIEMAREAAEQFPERLIPYVYALPAFDRAVLPDIEAAISQLGFRGIKIHAGEARLVDYIFAPVLELAADRAVPALIDCKGNAGAAARTADDFPAARLIIAHLGQYLCTSADLIDRFIAIAQSHENVYLDVSGVVLPWKIEDAVRRIGSARVLFGTDGPQQAPDAVRFAQREIGKIRGLALTESEQADVLGRTIAGLVRA